MKGIRHIHLHRGQSPHRSAVEIALVEVRAGGPEPDGRGFLVNVRVTREGKPPQESTRTPLPVTAARAETLWENERARRKQEGFVDENGPAPPRLVPAPPDVRAQTIIRYLETDTGPRDWPRSRIIQRAGDLRIVGAAPALARLVPSTTGIERIALAFALARIATPSISGALRSLAGPTEPETVQRFARAGLLAIPNERATCIATLLDELPSAICRAIQASDAHALAQAVDAYLASPDPTRPMVWVTLALLDTPEARDLLCARLRTLPLRPPHWRALRRIAKLAELRDDAEMLAILAHRIDKTRARPMGHQGFMFQNGQSRRISDIVRSGSNNIGYTVATRTWFRRHLLRTLRSRAAAGDRAYIDLALAILSAHHDDAQPSWLVGHILLAHSLEWAPPDRRPGPWRPRLRTQEPHQARTEAYASLWDEHPDALVRLACGGHTIEGARVGCVALTPRTDLARWVTLRDVQQLFLANTDLQANLALQALAALWQQSAPDLRVLLTLAPVPRADAQARFRAWFPQATRQWMSQPEVFAELFFCPEEGPRRLATDLLPAVLSMPDSALRLTENILSRLISTDANDTSAVPQLVCQFVETHLSRFIFALPLETLVSGLDAPHIPVREAISRWLVRHPTPVSAWPLSCVRAWMSSTTPSVRCDGVRAFRRCTNETQRSLWTHLLEIWEGSDADVRAIARGVLSDWLPTAPDYRAEVAQQLVAKLLQDERWPEFHVELATFWNEQPDHFALPLAQSTILALLDARGRTAQTVGGQYLPQLSPDTLSTDQVLALANHALLPVRTVAQMWIEADIPRWAMQEGAILGLIDADWPETRALGIRLLTHLRSQTMVDPYLLVAICDSAQPAAQDIGRTLLRDWLDDSHNPQWMMYLAEHPSPKTQAFVAAWAIEVAATDPHRLEAMTPYFRAVLFGLSRSALAKTRVFAALETAAMHDEMLARWVLALMEDWSGSTSVQDRARAIALMVRIRSRFGLTSSIAKVVPVPKSNRRLRDES